YRKFKECFGRDDADDLVWFAPSQVMNSKLPLDVIDHALAQDAAHARAEYLNIWREDLSDFIPANLIEAATDFGTYERAPVSNIRYYAFADAAGGLGSDSFALAIAHRDARTATLVLDAVRERKPKFVPAAVIADLAQLLKSYRIHEVSGDAYAGGFHS